MHAAGLEAAAMADLAPPVSLDQFMAHHTSEDNASFQEILEDTNKRKRWVSLLLLGAVGE